MDAVQVVLINVLLDVKELVKVAALDVPADVVDVLGAADAARDVPVDVLAVLEVVVVLVIQDVPILLKQHHLML